MVLLVKVLKLFQRMKVNQSLLADADDIAKVVIQSALSGDMQAASLVLSRIAPTLKAQTETVQFELDAALLHKDLKCKAPLIEPNLRRNLGKWST